MTDQHTYIKNRIRVGWGLLIAGLILFIAGLVLQLFFTVQFNARIIVGVGMVVTALGVARLFRYYSAQKDLHMAARVANEERDERSRMIRQRAGARAFWISLAMTYAALLWLSFASNGSLPTPSLDTLWMYLAAAVVIPMLIYIGSIVYDQQNS